MQFSQAATPTCAQELRLTAERIAASPGRVPGLDGLRAFSILIVISGHFLLKDQGGFAAVGVYVFFAISGFLITRLLYLENKKIGSIDLLHFYGRRILRLYPVLIVYMLITSLLELSRGYHVSVLEISSVFFYFVNYLITWKTLHGQMLTMQIGVLWSLSVEEHFYLFMPLLFVTFQGRLRPMFYIAIAALLLPLLVRCSYIMFWPRLIHELVTYRDSETRFDSIAVGVLLAIGCESRHREKIVAILSSRSAFVLCVLLFATAIVPNAIFRETLRFTTLSLASMLLVSAIVFGRNTSLLQRMANLPPAIWIGKISYALYVWHGATDFILRPYARHFTQLEYKLALFAIVFAAASSSYYLVERPALRLKRIFTVTTRGQTLPDAVSKLG